MARVPQRQSGRERPTASASAVAVTARGFTLSPLRLFTLGLLVFAAGFASGVLLHAATSRPAPSAAAAPTAQPANAAAPMVRLPGPSELRAVEDLRAHLEHASGDVAARIELANALFDMGKYREAATHYEQVLEVQPENADVRTDLGIAYRSTDRPQQAVEAFRRAIQSDPQHRNAHYNLGVVLAHDLNDPAGAITAYERYLELAPDAPNSGEVRRSLEELRRGR